MSIELGTSPEPPEPAAETSRGRVTVTVDHVRSALATKAGIRMESVSGWIDWPRKLMSAVPFQPSAARQLGEELRAFVQLRDSVAGVSVAIRNSLDWGERELVECIAMEGFGDPAAVASIDLRPFSSGDGIHDLLSPTPAATWGAEGSSILARFLQRRSGVLVLENFDVASESVQSFLAQGARKGAVTDLQGRVLSFRAFTTVFLLSAASTPRLGLLPSTRSEPDDRSDADITVSLSRPKIAIEPEAILNPLLGELSAEMGVRVCLSPDALTYLGGLKVSRGLHGYREQVRRLLAMAALGAPDLTRRRRLTIRMSAGELLAR